MALPSFTFDDLKQQDPMDAMIDRAFPMPKRPQSMAGPSIMLGFLDTVNKRSSEPLRNAIQNAESSLGAREAERRSMASQGMKEEYAAESNARNQLLAHVNKLDDDISSISSSYMMVDKPQLAKAQIAEKQRQREHFVKQLMESTEKIKASYNYGGETLVSPAGKQQAEEGQEEKAYQVSSEARNFIDAIFEKIPESKLKYAVNPNNAVNSFKEQYKAKNGSYPLISDDDLNKIYKESWEYKRTGGKAGREIAAEQAQHANAMKKEQIEASKLDKTIGDINYTKSKLKELGIPEDSPGGRKAIAMSDGINTFGAIMQSIELLLDRSVSPTGGVIPDF
ncbi:MAG: hypothetical protein LBH25_09575 [Fibromonadaceae bacterium]|jgi:hypothetical protein|nr:hypothetical protein [Fibromonadaceae bacterium]